MQVFFVTRFNPSPIGDGGNHRAYQIVHDLHQVIGPQNVTVINWKTWLGENVRLQTTNIDRRRTMKQRVARALPVLGRMNRMYERLPLLTVDEPIEQIRHPKSIALLYQSKGFRDYYTKQVLACHRPTVCLIDHPGFSDLIAINQKHSIPTIACTQNIESFDRATPLDGQTTAQIYLTAIDFANEFITLSQCQERFFISKVETAIFGGLGLQANYYPYRPVGAIRERMLTIRRQRNAKQIAAGRFLMLGSSSHSTTRNAFSWFVKQAQTHGLPPNSTVIIGGAGTEELQPFGAPIRGLEFRGWLPQEELDRLLTEVQAILIPQFTGFGTLTRLTEFSCAGIPVLVSRHPTFALDLPPGIDVVDDHWNSWYQRLGDYASYHGQNNIPLQVEECLEEENFNTFAQLFNELQDKRIEYFQ